MARRPMPKNLDPLLVRLMALAEPSRWRLLEILRERPSTVQQLASASGLSLAVTSRHVQRLRRTGLVIGERHGKELRCRPADPQTPVGRWLDEVLSGRTESARSAGPPRDRAEIPSERSSRPSVVPEAEPVPVRPGGDLEDFLL